MEGNDVALAEQVFYLHDANVAVGGCGTTWCGENVHTESASDGGDLLSDAAVTDDAEVKAGEFHERKIPVAEIRTLIPTPVAYGLGVMPDTIGQFEQERECGLGDGVRAIGRDVRDGDAALLCGAERR